MKKSKEKKQNESQ